MSLFSAASQRPSGNDQPPSGAAARGRTTGDRGVSDFSLDSNLEGAAVAGSRVDSQPGTPSAGHGAGAGQSERLGQGRHPHPHPHGNSLAATGSVIGGAPFKVSKPPDTLMEEVQKMTFSLKIMVSAGTSCAFHVGGYVDESTDPSVPETPHWEYFLGDRCVGVLGMSEVFWGNQVQGLLGSSKGNVMGQRVNLTFETPHLEDCLRDRCEAVLGIGKGKGRGQQMYFMGDKCGGVLGSCWGAAKQREGVSNLFPSWNALPGVAVKKTCC